MSPQIIHYHVQHASEQCVERKLLITKYEKFIIV
jgi:hypothetical protein